MECCIGHFHINRRGRCIEAVFPIHLNGAGGNVEVESILYILKQPGEPDTTERERTLRMNGFQRDNALPIENLIFPKLSGKRICIVTAWLRMKVLEHQIDWDDVD